MSDSPQPMNSLDCWDYTIELECLQGSQDLQLAAELGKTLLERNKELEGQVKAHQTACDEQAQEIEYLTKQVVALREVNDSRLKIYEQLEVSIHDLERANHRLAVENGTNKKQLKSYTATIESLEAKLEEHNGVIEGLRKELDCCKKAAEARLTEKCLKPNNLWGAAPDVTSTPIKPKDEVDCAVNVFYDKSQTTQTTPNRKDDESVAKSDEMAEQIKHLMAELNARSVQNERDQSKIEELEEQIASLVHQNQKYESQLREIQPQEDNMKSMHEELSTLEEVRQGQLCRKCFRNIDDASMSLCDEMEDDDSSMFELNNAASQYRNSFQMEVPEKSSSCRARQDKYRREISVFWMMPAASTSVVTLMIDLAIYFKDQCLVPFLLKSLHSSHKSYKRKSLHH